MGFTLIELLVVVAIIAVLIAVLLPALNQAREVSKSAVCSTRLKNIGWASQMYFNDNNNRVPTDTVKLPLRIVLHPYLNAFDRSFWESSINWACPNAAHMTPVPITVAYGMNLGVSMGSAANPWDWYYELNHRFGIEQVDASRFIWVSETGRLATDDCWTWSPDPNLEPQWNRWRNTPDFPVVGSLWTVVVGAPWGAPNGYPLVAFRHLTRANTLFLDGHVEGLSFGQMLNPRLWLRE